MKLMYLAHAAFLLTTSRGTRIITDPYQPGSYGGAVGYQPIDEEADIITISHSHEDHNYISPQHQKAEVVKNVGRHQIADISIAGFETDHDQNQGRERGKNIVFTFGADGLTICHCGDLGVVLDEQTVKGLGPVDVLLLPVGGFYTIDAHEADLLVAKIGPKVVIPMHYKTEKLGFDIAPVDTFLRGKSRVINIGKSEVEIDPAKLPRETEVWVLHPSKL